MEKIVSDVIKVIKRSKNEKTRPALGERRLLSHG